MTGTLFPKNELDEPRHNQEGSSLVGMEFEEGSQGNWMLTGTKEHSQSQHSHSENALATGVRKPEVLGL